MIDPSKLIGYETLTAVYKAVQKAMPEGIGLKGTTAGKLRYLQFQFRLPGNDKRFVKPTGCPLTEDGLRSALVKAQKVAEALRKFSTESELWAWYDAEILEKNVIKNDLITFGEVIKLIENDFWSDQSRTKQKRDRNNPSHQASWDRCYWEFYKHLPSDKAVNLPEIMTVIGRWNKGDKSYKDCVGVMRKLARFSKKAAIIDSLNGIDAKQTNFREDLQTIDIDAFLRERDEVLGVTKKLPPRSRLDSRKDWMWVFSMQIVYGLRIHEVFAIQNLTGRTCPKLNRSL